jgi:predicted O-methyltransferase YrrM
MRQIKKFFSNIYQSAKVPVQIREGLNHQSDMINQKLTEVLDELKLLTAIMSADHAGVTVGKKKSNIGINDGYQAPPSSDQSREATLQAMPLIFAPKTYNSNHPAYDANLVRNFPGHVFNMTANSTNPVFIELKKMIHNEKIADKQWDTILKETLEEVKTVPHANEVFQRKEFIEKYLKELETKHGAYYHPGWVNLEDALFLYWAVRKLQPKTIVQAGVCNGLSSAFMMLALAKNGPDGTLHVVDMPPVFDSTDDKWTIKGRLYGVVIPAGKTSGWIVPDAYRDRFEVLNGDAKLLLPGLLEKLGKIDMFYHDSDHTYEHMMFEFEEAKKYLNPHGIMMADDISWNASLWDFADQYMAPAYNYKGSMGIACF